MSTTASVGGRLKGRVCASTWPSSAGRHGIDADSLENVRGHRLPLRRDGFVPARGKTLLVGDAAGLVDPLTGDGMYEAFVSARLASEAVLDVLAGKAETVEPYTERLARRTRAARGRVVGGEGGARQVPSNDVRTRAGAARLAGRRAARARRHQGARRGARARAPAAEAIAALARLAGSPAA
jgi:2-polyprenyl-6-methoxyphenol hydroxylase-like FAD-dependent oxidoreductase